MQIQIKDAVQNPGTIDPGKLEMLIAKAEHARLTGPDVSKLRELLTRIQVTKGSLEQAIAEKKEAEINTNIDIQAFESVDQIVSNQIINIESDTFDKNKLLEIYSGL